MNDNIRSFLVSIKVGAKQSHRNMTVYCLLAAEEADVDFLTLDEALENKFLSVTELDEYGSVPELKVVNNSDRMVLMMDGEELVGAKQNRVLNVTVLIAAHSETIIPVSCVEQGRWSYRSREFASSRRAMSPDLKKKKSRSVRNSLRAFGSFSAAQGMVWQEIDAKFDRMHVAPSSTMALSDLYESHQEMTEDFLKAFHAVDYQIGMIVFIDGKIAGLELLGNFAAFKKNHAKLVQSYIMDALETAAVRKESVANASKARVSKVLESAAAATIEKRQSVGLGEDIRLESEEIVGAGLQYEGRVLQMSIFLNDLDELEKMKSPLSRASRRRVSLVR
ncbi:MAG: DUF6569 family protein [Thermodesulfobacteriota bacterium]